MAIDVIARGMAATAQQQITNVTTHDKGFFKTLLDLQTAHPVGVQGDNAIVGTTGTVWMWDVTSSAWVDSGQSPSFTADAVSFDNTSSKFAATQVQQAIDETVALLSVVNTDIYIDKNRTDAYVADGSIMRPFKTIAAAITALASSTATGFTIHIAHGIYNEGSSSLTLPNKPIVVYGNNASLITTGTITIPNPNFVRYNLFTTGNVVYDNFTAGARCIIQGGGITGNITVNSYVEMTMCQLNGGVVTVGATGQLVVITCSPTSTFVSAGSLFLERVNINTGKHDYLITSTAGFLSVIGSIVTNLFGGGCISCNNGALATPNIIANNYIIATTGIALNLGTARVVYSKNFISGAMSGGTGMLPVNTDAIGGNTIMGLGSDTKGDIYYRNATGILTRLGIGTEGQVLTVESGLPQWKTITQG